MKKIIECRNGETVRITRIEAGKGAASHLNHLGLNVGNVVTVSRRSNLRGPIVVKYRGTDIAIGHGIAQKIFVEEV